MDKKLISEIALRVDDINYDDFHYGIYERVLLRASRIVARRYKLIQREYKFTSYINVPDGEDEESYIEEKAKENIELSLMSFVSEYEVRINSQVYRKVNAIEENQKQYVLYRDNNKIWFNYSPRTKEDIVDIFYTSDINQDDYDIEEIQPIIPSQYNEELIAFAITELSKMGIVKFKNSEKGQKYSNAFKVYAIDPKNLDGDLLKDNPWAEMQVWRII